MLTSCYLNVYGHDGRVVVRSEELPPPAGGDLHARVEGRDYAALKARALLHAYLVHGVVDPQYSVFQSRALSEADRPG